MKWKKDRKEKKKSKKKSDQIIRIEELEEIIEKYGDDVDPETIVSMYVPHRQPKRLGAALLRMDKLHLVLLGMMLVVCSTCRKLLEAREYSSFLTECLSVKEKQTKQI